ncbi:MAG: HyaD/HybD family hydrogenase maturation endopeptidase [Syntrophomonadaceae bacterium]|jgi:hydrogenase maturation protease|nr:HyaD/HybD family hydrogenase maturation endopeptidase [Syntrophomonadaceae bacterium]
MRQASSDTEWPEGAATRPSLLVVGIGNLLMRDDGVGIHVIERLKQLQLPPQVELIDGGTHTYDLVDIFCQADDLIVVDALRAGGEPGTIYRAPLEELGLRPEENLVSLHQMSFVEAINLVHMLGHYPRVVVFGIEPKEVALSLELSAEVAGKIPRVVELVQQEIHRILQTE